MTALVTRCGDSGGLVVSVANAGDARCLLVRLPSVAGEPLGEPLSLDHVPTLASEAERIAGVGGIVARGRLLGVLAVSRAIGDVCLKPSVTAQPHTAAATLPPGQRAALLLFCDGVSAVMDDEETAACVAGAAAADAHAQAALGEGVTRQAGGDAAAAALASALVAEAMRRGTRDNVTALCVLL